MSDFWINLSLDETAQKKAPVGKLNRKKEWLHRNRHHCGAKGYKEGKHNNQYREDFRQSQTPLQNGASIECPPPPTSTQNKSLPCLASASHSSSMPPFGEKPKEPLKSAASSPGSSVSSTCKPITMSSGNPSKYVAIDCEMVGTGPKRLSELARCSIVSYEGDVIYDQFIQPSAQVTDYRTRWSGIRRRDLVNAMPFAQARMEVRKVYFFFKRFSMFFYSVKCLSSEELREKDMGKNFEFKCKGELNKRKDAGRHISTSVIIANILLISLYSYS
ncbi:ankyrin repeat and IBR domain-containing protein 1 [Sarotherodon galilaeus]